MRAHRFAFGGKTGPQGATGATGAAGSTGPTGPPIATTYSATIATPGASSAAPNTVVLATLGPFTVTGERCFTSAPTVEAETAAATSLDHAAFNDYEQGIHLGGFLLSSGALLAGYAADGTQESPAMYGPHDGSTRMVSADGQTDVNLFTGVGSHLGSRGGATGPACSFFGYHVTC